MTVDRDGLMQPSYSISKRPASASTLYEIIEIGAVKSKRHSTRHFFDFVRPSRKISRKISELTNISNEDVAKAPAIEEVLLKFVEFIGDSILAAHNATFDTGFIYYAMKQLGIYQKISCIDTLQLAR